MSMKKDQGGDGLGRELGELYASVPVPKAPAWFAARTMARLRREEEKSRGWFGLPRWILIGAGAALLAVGWLRWESQSSVADAELFAALDAMVEEEKESRWWAGL
jgi:type VI protein secretion system component VasF